MSRPVQDAPPRSYARLTGVLYLVIIVCAGFSEGVVRAGLVVPADAAVTAANIRDSEWLFRLGFLTDLVAFLSDAAVAVLFYVLLRPVNQVGALVASVFRLAQATILGLNMLHHFAALLLLSGSAYLTAFGPDQIEALVLLAMEGHRYGYLIGQMFFGVHCVLIGWLIWRAWYFPGALGGLMVLAGIGYLADGTSFFLFPGQAPAISPLFIAPVVVAELSLCIYLLAKGVRERPAPGRGA